MEKSFVPGTFPYVKCEFDKRKDLKETDQVGFLDLNRVFETGVVEGVTSFDESTFNGVQDPGAILPRPKDIFERYRQGDYVRSALAATPVEPESSASAD